VTAFAPEGVLKERYRLERLLGRGGMASVWLGHDEMLDRPVAVKVLSDTIASDPGFLARFRREAKVAAGLSHPNLVGIYDYAEGGERPYLVMEFVPGENLGSRLARGAPVDCGRLAEELLDAVAHIHGVGILHRDIKPENIVLTPDGGAKLISALPCLPTRPR
jgi:eukaryotic-like serine/threonine-protein kinase